MEQIEDEIETISNCSARFKNDMKAINDAIDEECIKKTDGEELTSAGICRVR